MIIEVNKDIDNYKESVVLGLTARQLLYSALSVIVGGGIVLLLYKHIGLTASTYVAIPVVAPIALTGFYSYNGMTFMEMVRRKLYFAFKNPTLTYVSTESEQVVRDIRMQEEMQAKNKKESNTANSKDDFQKAKKKMLLTVVLLLLVITGFVLAAIVFQQA